MSISFGRRTMLAAACIWLAVGCTKRNPDVCCETAAECTAVGFSDVQSCDLGVCVDHACTTELGACDDDRDCDGTANAAGTSTSVCISNACAVCASSAACPASAPVCDDTSHDCRACATDAECASGACDLGAGTCVDAANVLYASVTGADTDACTALIPCSLARAAQSVDASHTYIVMAPGRYVNGAVFEGKTAVVVGNGASIDGENGVEHFMEVLAGSVLTVRDLILEDHLAHPDGDMPVLLVDDSELIADRIQGTANFTDSIRSNSGKMTIRHSVFSTRGPFAYGELVIDSCTFLADGPKLSGAGTVTNSIFNTPPGGTSISLSDGPYVGNIEVTNNTFINGYIGCSGMTNAFRSFTDNIFYHVDSAETSLTCGYDYNLFEPSLEVGTDEVTGEPLFVDFDHGDFHLRSGSPAIDAGAPNLLTNGQDFDGKPRPVGGRPDLGAFEYTPPAAP